jgi:hypothetical protein
MFMVAMVFSVRAIDHSLWAGLAFTFVVIHPVNLVIYRRMTLTSKEIEKESR